MQTESQNASIWRRIIDVLTEMDGAFHPADYQSERLASLEARVQRLEAEALSPEKPDLADSDV